MKYIYNKKFILKLIAVMVTFVMAFQAAPIYAASTKTVTIKLKVKSGDDISNKFNKASDKARHNKKGKKYIIKVPKGNYKIGSQIRLYSNTTADFTGSYLKHTTSSSTVLRLGRKSKDWEKYNHGRGHPGYSGFKNIKIIGGTFDGNGLKKAIMRFGHSKNISIIGTKFKNVKKSHLVEFGACDGVLIKNCSFSDYVGDYSGYSNCEALQFDALAGNHFSAYNPNGDETPCRNVKIIGCTFRNLKRGLGTHTGVVNSYFSNFVIESNTFENITGYAILTTNYKNATIRNNTIRNCGSGILFRMSDVSHSNYYASKFHSNVRTKYELSNSKIYGNKIYVTSGYKVKYICYPYGIQLYGENLTKKTGTMPKGDYRCAGVKVYNNYVCMQTKGTAIYKKNTKECKVYSNTVVKK